MQILGPNNSASAVFIVAPGKQVTLSAQGLSGDDVVVIEIVTLSSAPEFKGNPCCDLVKANIEVISAVPLKCPDGTLVTMTAEYPFVVLDGPQMVTMRARIEADAGAAATVDLNESDSDGCTLCACRTVPCEDTEWTPTGNERCVGTDVEREEESNCGNTRWVVDRPQTWTDTGEIRCSATEVEKKQINDCGTTKWVVKGPLTWTPTGQERCVGANVEREEKNDCCCETRWVVDRAQTWYDTGETRCVGTNVEKQQENDCKTTRWIVLGPQTWTPTGETRCSNYLVEREEINDCGKTRWVVTTDVCGFCASFPVPMDQCDGQQAFGFREGDVRDPLATVEVTDCDGGNKVYFYPAPGPGHSVPVTECDGTLIGYGANTSECATGVPSRIEIGSLPPLRIEKLPKLEIGKLPDLTIGEMPVVEIKRHLVEAIRVDNEVWTYWSDGTKQVEKLVVPAEPVVYCPSLRISCDGQPGYGFHDADPADPAATVILEPCPGDTSVDRIRIYPAAGPGHTVKVLLDGVLKGYAANRSDCAADCGCPKAPVITVNSKPTVNVAAPAVSVAAPEVTVTLPAPTLVAHALSDTGVLTSTLSNGPTVTSNPLPSC